METNNFDKLPKDILVSIAIELDFPQIVNFCKTSKRFNESICKNENFWISKLNKDYEIKFDPNKIGSARKYYEYITQQIRETINMEELAMRAVENCNLDLLDYALKGGAENLYIELTEKAAIYGCLDILVFLLYSFEYNENNKLRLLKLSAENGNLRVVKFLVEEFGVDPAGNENMALRVASQNNKLNVVSYLLQQGVDINSGPNTGNALVLAALLGDVDTVKFLIENNADPNFNHGIPLIAAIQQKRLDIIRYLVEHGAHTTENIIGAVVNGNNILYNNILVAAIQTGDYNIVKYLVDHGAIVSDGLAVAAAALGNMKIAWLLK